MPRSAFLWLALHFPLFLPAATEKEIYTQDEPHVVNGVQAFSTFVDVKNVLEYDRPESCFWFRLEAGSILILDKGAYTKAKLLIELAADTRETDGKIKWLPAKIKFNEAQSSPIEFRYAEGATNEKVVITSDKWTTYDGQKAVSPAWTSPSVKVDCNVVFDTPLPVNAAGEAKSPTISIQPGRSCFIEMSTACENQYPTVELVGSDSQLVFDKTEEVKGELRVPKKYRDLMTTSSGCFYFERDVIIEDKLIFSGSPTIDFFGETTLGGIEGGTPWVRIAGGTLCGTEGSRFVLGAPEGEPCRGLVVNTSASLSNVNLNAMTASGTVDFNAKRPSSIDCVTVNGGKALELTSTREIPLPFKRVHGSGSLTLTEVKGTLTEIDAALREGGFTGTLILNPTSYGEVDLSTVSAQTFPYTFAPQTGGQAFRLSLDQYRTAKFEWPDKETSDSANPSLTLIGSDAYAGQAEVPAFPDWVDFTFLRADGTTEIECEVGYGTETNTLKWDVESQKPGFAALPDEVNQLLAPDIPEGKVAGEIIGIPVRKAAEALRCFSGIHKVVPREGEDIVDLYVDYAFGISRLTVVDGGESVLVEVTLTSGAMTDAPDFWVKPVLVVNGTALAAEPLTEEAIAERGLSAPSGAATRWFLVPLDDITGALSVRVGEDEE